MIGGSINASANCEGLPLGWDRDVQGLFSVNPRALCRPYRAVWVKTQRPGATPQARRVVGWTNRNGGSPCLVQVYLVRWGGRVGWLLCGGNNGLRILAHPQDPDLRTPRDAHLPNGWGVPILFLNRRDIDVFEPERVMDDPAMRRRIRETYQASMSEILRNYPRYDPYLGFEWSAIFTPIEWNVWSDIRDLGLPMYPQFPVGPYFLDFADPVKKLGIEVDSRRYHEDREKDRLREQHLELQGWTIIRITGRQTYKEPDEAELDDAETLPVEDTNDQWNWAILDSSTAMLRFVQRYYYADRR